MNGYLGEIRLFPFAWAPEGWLPCNGSVLQIARNPALFSLIGTVYGGDGKTTFALPDLRGRVAACQGNPQVEAFPLKPGAQSGSETAAIPLSILPQHSHAVNVSTAPSNNTVPQGGVPAISRRAAGQQVAGNIYVTAQADKAVVINGATVAPTPGAPVANMQPSLVLNYCILVNGYYPTRP
ncbi:hypothetical protein CCOS865_03274 [Pseudomonas reidholzensis]|uniref:Phage tail collar domain-containing protein n=1 Tax=Pseudomonas reidholzensis TaxID=1785162 RepID=A0A383RVS2_9PSED|nr:tail fiber protein [Pseudomonas reidholzensis]SYX91005.1 hypothetical protein CCOS865_03274 [Pseudomonas reidholzensis]